MKNVMRLMAGILLLSFFLGCGPAPEVVQGTVVSYDETTKVLVIKDEQAPNPEVTLSVEKAEMGAAPAVGDLVRVAYHDQAGQRKATRVMNLTRDTELKKSAEKH